MGAGEPRTAARRVSRTRMRVYAGASPSATWTAELCLPDARAPGPAECFASVAVGPGDPWTGVVSSALRPPVSLRRLSLRRTPGAGWGGSPARDVEPRALPGPPQAQAWSPRCGSRPCKVLPWTPSCTSQSWEPAGPRGCTQREPTPPLEPSNLSLSLPCSPCLFLPIMHPAQLPFYCLFYTQQTRCLQRLSD